MKPTETLTFLRAYLLGVKMDDLAQIAEDAAILAKKNESGAESASRIFAEFKVEAIKDRDEIARLNRLLEQANEEIANKNAEIENLRAVCCDPAPIPSFLVHVFPAHKNPSVEEYGAMNAIQGWINNRITAPGMALAATNTRGVDDNRP